MQTMADSDHAKVDARCATSAGGGGANTEEVEYFGTADVARYAKSVSARKAMESLVTNM